MNKKGTSTIVVVITTMIVTIMLCYIFYKIWSYSTNMVVIDTDNHITTDGRITKVLPQATQDKLYNLKRLIDSEFLYEVDDEKMADLLAAGMLASLNDPYAQYYNKESFETFRTQTEGEYYGIGIYVTYDEDKQMPIVLTPLENSPALEAGLQMADYIEYVNDLKAYDSTYTEIIDEIKGLPGTYVKIGVIRLDENEKEQHLEFSVERRKIELNPLKTDIIDGNIAYLKMTSFDEMADKNFEKAYTEFISNPNIESMIIDLRDNPGGVLSVCAYITDLIVPEGKIVYTVDKQGSGETLMSDSKQIEIPLVVLVNNSSASASEVFTAAVKDYGVGTIIGNKTYGKGVVQSLLYLRDGTYVKFTTSEYFSPKGNKIDGIGVTPDIEVDLPEDIKTTYNLEYEKDTQLQKAIEVLKNRDN